MRQTITLQRLAKMARVAGRHTGSIFCALKPGNAKRFLSTGQAIGKGASAEANDIARILKNGYDIKLINDGFRKLVRNLSLDYLLSIPDPGLSKETFLSIAISHIFILILRPDKQEYQGMAVS